MSPVTIGGATLYLGDCREILPLISGADACITDPPYGDTSLEWDRIVDGWVWNIAGSLKPSAAVWIFGSMRFIVPLFTEFSRHLFRYSQDIVWEKQNGTGFHNDRFRRVHEHAVMFYRGSWADCYHDTQYTQDATAKTVRRKTRPTHTGQIDAGHYVSEDGGPRMMRSVIYQPNEHGRAVHPTQKPVDLIRPLIRYSVPPGGTVLDPFAGSASHGLASLDEGRRYIGIERDERYFDLACKRLEQSVAQGNLFAQEAACR